MEGGNGGSTDESATKAVWRPENEASGGLKQQFSVFFISVFHPGFYFYNPQSIIISVAIRSLMCAGVMIHR